jgi:peptidoglycan/LPS O-acetylase OafA/YrhL
MGSGAIGPESGPLLFAVVLGLSTAVAAAGWRLVEAPSIAAGRALIRAGRGRVAARSR